MMHPFGSPSEAHSPGSNMVLRSGRTPGRTPLQHRSPRHMPGSASSAMSFNNEDFDFLSPMAAGSDLLSGLGDLGMSPSMADQFAQQFAALGAGRPDIPIFDLNDKSDNHLLSPRFQRQLLDVSSNSSRFSPNAKEALALMTETLSNPLLQHLSSPEPAARRVHPKASAAATMTVSNSPLKTAAVVRDFGGSKASVRPTPGFSALVSGAHLTAAGAVPAMSANHSTAASIVAAASSRQAASATATAVASAAAMNHTAAAAAPAAAVFGARLNTAGTSSNSSSSATTATADLGSAAGPATGLSGTAKAMSKRRLQLADTKSQPEQPTSLSHVYENLDPTTATTVASILEKIKERGMATDASPADMATLAALMAAAMNGQDLGESLAAKKNKVGDGKRGQAAPKRGEYKCGKCGFFPKKNKHNCAVEREKNLSSGKLTEVKTKSGESKFVPVGTALQRTPSAKSFAASSAGDASPMSTSFDGSSLPPPMSADYMAAAAQASVLHQ